MKTKITLCGIRAGMTTANEIRNGCESAFTNLERELHASHSINHKTIIAHGTE
ncbi:MAG: hypothetical protein HUK08_08305 [Bacteroidaceae bacterium]|nr:hypothetical protein [Bacteroidaceae bacterium]